MEYVFNNINPFDESNNHSDPSICNNCGNCNCVYYIDNIDRWFCVKCCALFEGITCDYCGEFNYLDDIPNHCYDWQEDEESGEKYHIALNTYRHGCEHCDGYAGEIFNRDD